MLDRETRQVFPGGQIAGEDIVSFVGVSGDEVGREAVPGDDPAVGAHRVTHGHEVGLATVLGDRGSLSSGLRGSSLAEGRRRHECP